MSSIILNVDTSRNGSKPSTTIRPLDIQKHASKSHQKFLKTIGSVRVSCCMHSKSVSHIRLQEGCSQSLVESTEAKATTNSEMHVEHLECGQRAKCVACVRDHLPPLVVIQCLAKRCASLESIDPKGSSVRLRHLSRYPHNSEVMIHVFDKAMSEGQRVNTICECYLNSQ